MKTVKNWCWSNEGKKACHVSWERLAETLHSLEYSPKRSAAQYFHCCKHQWKAVLKASTSFQGWLIGMIAAFSYSHSLNPAALDSPVTAGSVRVPLAADYRSSRGCACTSKTSSNEHRDDAKIPPLRQDKHPKIMEFQISGYFCNLDSVLLQPFTSPIHTDIPQKHGIGMGSC